MPPKTSTNPDNQGQRGNAMTTDYSRPLAAGFAALALLIAIGVSVSVQAHHSFSAFDLDTRRRALGTVVSFDWTHPHVSTRIDLQATVGVRAVASFEGMSPDYLGRRGWNRSTLRSGDLIEIVYFPRRDGQPGGMMLQATLPDGTLKIMAGPP
jgi:hypothetical protein